MTNSQKGAVMMLLSAFFMAGMQVSVNFTSSAISFMDQVFARHLIGFAASAVLCRELKLSLKSAKPYARPLLVNSLFGWLSMYTLFYASRYAQQGDVAILSKLSPFLVIILSAIFLKEKLTRIQIPALILSLIGGYIAADPAFTSDKLPLLAAFISCLFGGVTSICLRSFGGKVHPLLVALCFSGFSVLASAPFVLVDFSFPSTSDLAVLALLGTLGYLGQIFITYGFAKVSATTGSIYSQSGILFSILFGFLFLDQIPQQNTLVGAFLVFAATFLLYQYGEIL